MHRTVKGIRSKALFLLALWMFFCLEGFHHHDIPESASVILTAEQTVTPISGYSAPVGICLLCLAARIAHRAPAASDFTLHLPEYQLLFGSPVEPYSSAPCIFLSGRDPPFSNLS